MMNPNQSQNVQQNTNSPENTEKLHRKIKETWSGLSDSDIKLYDGKRDEFFANLEKKQNISKDDAELKMHQLEKECGCTDKAKKA